MKFNTLGDRMMYLRGLTDYKLIPNSYVIIMLDGRSFSKIIKNKFEKPFSDKFIHMMNETAKFVCENVQGCKFGYVQSDEISLLLTDFDTPYTDAFFEYRLSKLQSIIASLATGKFNQLLTLDILETPSSIDDLKETIKNTKLVQFDCKAWNVPSLNDVFGWFTFRQNDCIRNSISQTAQTFIPHNELQNLKTDNLLKKLNDIGIDWNSFDNGKKYGRFLSKKTIIKEGCENPRRIWEYQDAYLLRDNKTFFLEYIDNITNNNENSFAYKGL